MIPSEWRAPSEQERALIDRLLSATFTGKALVAEQLRSARVRTIDPEGSLAFEISSPERAQVRHPVPIEAEATDRDGMTLHALLHVVGGKVSELEFFKDDSSAILEMPPPNQWRLVELHG